MKKKLIIDHNSSRHKKLDQFEADILSNFGVGTATYRHFFVGGVYAREMTIGAGQFLTSLIHKKEHIWIISKGSQIVSVDDGEAIYMEAPCTGITKPGTRRAGFIVQDMILTTFHKTNIKPVDDSEEAIEAAAKLVVEEVTEPHFNSVLGGYLVQNELTKPVDTDGNLLTNKTIDL